MSETKPPPESAIVAAEPSRPITPRPLLSEIIRTRYCAPGSILLVENIEAHVPVSKRYRTVRLLLGDGELCIQALLRTVLHCFVGSGQVFVGCYVRLNRFELHSSQLRPDQLEDDDGSEAPMEMVFLVVHNITTVGWNTAYMEMAGTTGQEAVILRDSGAQDPHRAEEVASAQVDAVSAILPDTEARTADPKEDTNEAVDEADEDDDFEVMNISEQRANDRRREAALLQSRPSHLTGNSNPWPSSDLSQPLRLTPLKSIPNLPYKQNWAVNILAVVSSLSDVEPALLPSYVGKQRTARLADPSTSKQVLLTVFLDPDEFAPEVGSVVLLLGVKNHRFDGGSLKKYGNEKPKHGAPWWFENPSDIAWCDVEGLRSWWKSRSL